MMTQFYKIAYIGLIGMIVSACALTPEERRRELAAERLEAQVLDQPDWYLEPPQDDDYIYGVGTSGLSNLSMGVAQGRSQAMVEIAQQISAAVDSMTTDTFTGQQSNVGTIEKGVFESAARNITTAKLKGIEVLERQTVRTENSFQTYVLVRLSREAAARSAVEEIAEQLDPDLQENNKRLLDNLDEAVKQRLSR